MTTATLDIGIVGLETYGMNRTRTLVGFGHDVYGSDASPEVRGEFERRFNGETFENPTALLEQDLDAIVITTPNKFHETIAVEAMEQGFDVFTEKPLAHTLESAERIATTAEQTGRICMVGYYNRFLNVCRVLRRYIREGYFGEISHVRATYLRRRGVPGRGSWYTSKELAGGGALMDIGTHVLDLLFYFLDQPTVADLNATTRQDFGDRASYAYLDMWGEDDDAKMFDVEDSVTGFFEFEGNCTATVQAAWAANAESVHAYRIHGTEAGALLDITDLLMDDAHVQQSLTFYEARGGEVDHYIDSDVTVNANDPYDRQLETFTEAIATGESPTQNTVEQALAVQRIVDRIYGSTDHGI